MVHNGIEYADMQLIAVNPASPLCSSTLAALPTVSWRTFHAPGTRENCTAIIHRNHRTTFFLEADDYDGGYHRSYSLDSAGQKAGTGRWVGIESPETGRRYSMITAACNASASCQTIWRRQKGIFLLSGTGSSHGRVVNTAGFCRNDPRGLYG